MSKISALVSRSAGQEIGQELMGNCRERRELEEKFKGSTPEVVTDSRVTITKAVDLYLLDRETGLGGLGSVLDKTRRELKRFRAFMELRSVFFGDIRVQPIDRGIQLSR